MQQARAILWMVPAAILLWASSPSAAVGPLAVCEKGKLSAVGKGLLAALKCPPSRPAGAGRSIRSVQKGRDKLAASFVRAETKSPCPRTGEASAVTTASDDLATALGGALTATGVSHARRRS